MTRLFVAFNFSNSGLLSRKITGFRKRFDPNFNKYSFPHMAMLAPFEVENRDAAEDLAETLKEEMETFFFGVPTTPRLSFQGLGVYEHKRKHILYLKAHYDADLRYCSEIVQEICMSYIPRKVHYKPNKEQFLPLGYFSNLKDLHEVMAHAQVEFRNNSFLPIDSISLYENNMGIWFEKDSLISFEENESTFLQLNHPSL